MAHSAGEMVVKYGVPGSNQLAAYFFSLVFKASPSMKNLFGVFCLLKLSCPEYRAPDTHKAPGDGPAVTFYRYNIKIFKFVKSCPSPPIAAISSFVRAIQRRGHLRVRTFLRLPVKFSELESNQHGQWYGTFACARKMAVGIRFMLHDSLVRRLGALGVQGHHEYIEARTCIFDLETSFSKPSSGRASFRL